MSRSTAAPHPTVLLLTAALALQAPADAASSSPATTPPAAGAELPHRRSPCDHPDLPPDAECGTFRVFEDRERGEGRTLDLRFLLLPATGELPPAEPLVLLAGGPGQGGTQLLALARGPFEKLRERRPVVMVDLRGTGGSNPLECDTPGVEENPQAIFGHLFDPEVFAACARRLRQVADLTLYTTPLSVDDLEDLRRWLGFGKVVLWGGSGGTRTALVYMRRHPDSVAAAVLDSPAPVGFHAPLDYAADSQRALDKIFEACRVEPACRSLYPELAADFESLVERLRRGPVETTFSAPSRQDGPESERTVRFHLGDFGYAVRGLLYRGDARRRLPAMITRAADSGDLGEFAAAYWQRHRALEAGVQEGLHISTLCTEDTRRIVDAEIPRAARDTFLGEYLIDEYRGACAVWDVGEMPASYYEPVRSDILTLVLTGDLDPTTPPRFGREAVRHLSRAFHLTIDDASHGVSFGDCARPIVLDFLETLQLPEEDPLCSQQGRLDMAPERQAE